MNKPFGPPESPVSESVSSVLRIAAGWQPAMRYTDNVANYDTGTGAAPLGPHQLPYQASTLEQGLAGPKTEARTMLETSQGFTPGPNPYAPPARGPFNVTDNPAGPDNRGEQMLKGSRGFHPGPNPWMPSKWTGPLRHDRSGNIGAKGEESVLTDQGRKFPRAGDPTPPGAASHYRYGGPDSVRLHDPGGRPIGPMGPSVGGLPAPPEPPPTALEIGVDLDPRTSPASPRETIPLPEGPAAPGPMGFRGSTQLATRIMLEQMPADGMIRKATADGLNAIQTGADRLSKAIAKDGPLELPDPVVLQFSPSILQRIGAGLTQQGNTIVDGYKTAAEFTANAQMRHDELRVTQEGYRRMRLMDANIKLAGLDADRADVITDMLKERIKLATTEASVNESRESRAATAAAQAAHQQEVGQAAHYTGMMKGGDYGLGYMKFLQGYGMSMTEVSDEAGNPTGEFRPMQSAITTVDELDHQYSLLTESLNGHRPMIGERLYQNERSRLDVHYARQRENMLTDNVLEIDASDRIREAATAAADALNGTPYEMSDAFLDRDTRTALQFGGGGGTLDYLENDAIEDEALAKSLRTHEQNVRMRFNQGLIDEVTAAKEVFVSRAAADIKEYVNKVKAGKRSKTGRLKKETDVMLLLMAYEGGSDATLKHLGVDESVLVSVRSAYEKKYGARKRQNDITTQIFDLTGSQVPR